MKKFKLNELGSVDRGKSKHRPRNDLSLYGGEYPFIQTGDVKHSPFYLTSHTQTYNEKGLEQSKLWPVNTLCITIAANIAETAILTYPACFPDSIIGFIPDPDKAELKYIKYCLDTFKLQMQSISQGTTQDNMSVEKLLSIDFPIPELHEQRKVAAILSSYDDLIENNKKRIALLVKVAEEIYREWFVRFRFPGYKKATFEKGIPEDWNVISLDQLVEITSSKRIFLSDYVDVGVPFYRSKEVIERSKGSEPSSPLYISEEKFLEIHEKFGSPKENDILVTSVGTLGIPCLVKKHDRFYFKDGNLIWFKSQSDINSKFIFFWINTPSGKGSLLETTIGSSQQAFTISGLKKVKILMPNQEILSSFFNIIDSINSKKENLITQNRNLKSTKDNLLQRLISGKLSVEDLDIQFPASMLDKN
ncbi:restriction endonuclease subunit S [Shewanella atlantica]|nr:restriction endonuclease subunit S [Shewanella atlantica]